jgi:hypothetical protein
MYVTVMNLVTPEAAANHELLFDKPPQVVRVGGQTVFSKWLKPSLIYIINNFHNSTTVPIFIT